MVAKRRLRKPARRTRTRTNRLVAGQRSTRRPPQSKGLRLSVTVNGELVTRSVEPRKLLVDFVREDLRLTGTHIGCDTTHCGACTVLLDGDAIKSCTMLAIQADGRSVTTIEGLSRDGRLDPLQESFKEHHGLQCGFCTPGVVLAAKALLDHNPSPTEEEIREGISGNLCRCTGYVNVIRSISAMASPR